VQSTVVPPGGEALSNHYPLIDGAPADVAVRAAGATRFVLEEAGERTRLVIEPAVPAEGGVTRREVLVGGFRFEVDAEPERIAALRERATRGRAASGHGGPLEVKAIIPGKVVSISVKAGDEVTAGQQLLVVEAMKMQNELRAPRDGTISRVGVAQGANIDVGDLLVVIS
jgi:biotin carboxyl carrier protein